MSGVEDIVCGAIWDIVGERNPGLGGALPSHRLREDLAFTSLDFADLGARLEERFDVDPFVSVSTKTLRTVGDICRLYADLVGNR